MIVPFPSLCRGGNGTVSSGRLAEEGTGIGRRSVLGSQRPTFGVARDFALALETTQGARKGLIPDLEFGAEFDLRHRNRTSAKKAEHLTVEVERVRGLSCGRDVEARRIAGKRERDGFRCPRRSMFDGEADRAALDRSTGAMVGGFFEVQVRVAPGMQIGRPSECLPGDRTVAFAGVVDEEHGEVEAPLQRPQIGEQPGDVCGLVLI